MDPLHSNAFFTLMVERTLPFRTSIETKLIDDSIYYKIRYRIASILANKIIKKSKHPARVVKGQHVTAIFKKPINQSV